MMKSKVNLTMAKCRKVSPTDYVINLDNMTTSLVNTIYKAALLDNKITLKELEYQSKYTNIKSFRKLVVAAFVLKSLEHVINKKEKNVKTKKNKTTL